MISLIHNLIKNTHVIRTLSRRMLHSSFRQASLGWFWLVGQPLMMMAMFTYVFGTIFHGRYGDYEHESIWQYAVGVYMSLTLFSFASDVLVGAVVVLESYREFMRKTALPPEVIVAALVSSCFVRFLAGFIPSLLLAAVILGLPLSSLWFLAVFPAYFLFVGGLAFLMATLGRRFPDIRQTVTVLSTALMWSSAVFYSKSLVAPALRELNPVLIAVDLCRQFVLWGRPIAGFWGQVLTLWASGIAIIVAGMLLLAALRHRLSD